MLKTRSVHVRIDDATISRGKPLEIIDPVWWRANIYDGPAAYEKSLSQFSKPQRLIWAMLWYEGEVSNGGHHQFYMNSTGIVWRDALEGFETVGLPEVAAIIRESANRLGGSPSLDRGERRKQVEKYAANFDDLDERYYKIKGAGVRAKMMDYICGRPADFYFSGTVERPILPGAAC